MKLLPLVVNEELEKPSPSTELYDRLRDMAIRAVPEVETATWAADMDRALKPEDLPILLLKFQGLKIGEIATELGRGAATVSRILRSPAAQHLLRKMYAESAAPSEALQVLESAAVRAAETVVDVMENADDKTKLRAAFSILDRLGYGARKQVEVTQTIRTEVTTSELQNFSAVLKESMEPIDGDFEVVASVVQVVENENEAEAEEPREQE